MKLTSSTMARSDSEDVYEVTDCTGTTLMKLQNLDVDDTVLDKPNDRTIHSGHFMVSHAHEEGEEAAAAVDNSSGYDLEIPSPGHSPGDSGGGGYTSVHGGKSATSLVIDGSLRKLFDCMTLAHCNTLTSPKWRNFKGINVRLKDKIRLNNIIWREWHLQYIKGASPIVCHFETPVSSKNDGRLEYWKLRLDSLTKDYKRLSRFFADRFSAQPDDHELLTRLPSSYYELLQRVSQSTSKMTNSSLITVPMFPANDSVIMDDDAINEIFDTLFTPYAASRGNPSNINAQTSLEEFMDTLDPLPPPLAIDFRGFGRLSSTASGCSSANTFSTMRRMINPVESGGMCNTTVTVQPNQSLPSVSSQPLSFGSAEEVLALLQSQLTSEASLEYLLNDPASIISSSGYSSGATIQSGFTISDGNLVSTGDDVQLLPSNGIDMQEFPSDETTGQMCSMFFLPETVSTGQPIFTAISEPSGTGIVTCNQSLEFSPSCMADKNLQLYEFLQAANASQEPMSTLTSARALPGASISLPRLKSRHDLMGAGQASRSLGSMQTSEMGKGYQNVRTSADAPPRATSSVFRVPQKGTGARPKYSTTTLPQLQPKQQVTSVAVLRQEVQPVKQGTTLILPKQTVQQPPSTSGWSLQGNAGTDYLAVPMADQYSFIQDAQMDSSTTQANQPAEMKRRMRHKSDQSSASQGTTIRPIAVFQPINPLQTKSTGRISSKGNCSVSFKLDKNTSISPSPVADSPAMQMSNMSTNVILATSGHAVVAATMADTSGMKAFRENLSCPGIFDSSSQSCDFSDMFSLNSSSARSRHTSNESSSSHYDELGGRTSMPKPEMGKNRELRRVSHINAEQKRRSNIKCGFDTLINMIPELKDSPNSRVSKATALHTAAELCKKLKQEKVQKHDEVEQLRNEIKALEADISACQSQLPATGAPPVKHPVEQLNERFEDYVCKRSLENWKYFIFGSITQPLLKSFDEDVTRGSTEQLRKSILGWLQSHCSLASLRPLVTNALLNLSVKTSILSDPSLVPEEVREIVLRQRNSQR